ncbi:autorepressor SdpR family transcription factor [Peptoniphilus catoniae]|uniref:autorepressor SdpR family transcription factor n=1 Tax=Peptoniphilus catoniae TaxID=1660341 RepID=UPI0010FE4002|nr:autorepressor SdpR family transcription factor [Peptoniphilus catoniae]
MNFEKTFKALGDKNRREILLMLKGGRMSAGEIAENFNMTKATLSYHLSLLKDAGLVIDTREKNFIYYSLNASVFEELVGNILNFIEGDGNEKKDDI